MSSIMLQDKDVNSDKLTTSTLDPGTSYEVFRNNTTAVEVIVKDVYNKGKKKSQDFFDMKMKVQADVDRLHYELDNANKSLVKTRKGFQTIIREMRKQIDTANSREADTQTINLALKLENEKLRILLNSKTKLLSRVKKELAAIKRVLKFVVKSICNAPEIPGSFERGSDTEYEDFENDLKVNETVKISTKISDKFDTFDTTVSKDHDFDKKV